jgi:RNA polymerase sigma factor (sigma-70 family)
MGSDPTTVAQYLCDRLSGGSDGPSDGDLLDAFAATRSEAEFATLLARHGPMVLGVCRRLLGNATDAEDAFQAVFLVLAQRAAALAGVRSVCGWLYGTAVRVAQKARVREARRQAREKRAFHMRQAEPPDEPDWDDLRTVLDEELDQLGARYRDPVVLCCLEGKSREEAARLLGWPEGTVNGRLSRAKELLRARLARRGVTCSVTALTTLLTAHGLSAVPPALARNTLATLAGPAPVGVTALAAGAPSGWKWWRVLGAGAVGLVLTGWLIAFGVRAPPEPKSPDVPNQPAPPVRMAHGAEVLALAVSSDGRVATVGTGSEVRIWKADGTPAARCAFPGGGAAGAFSPDGKTLAAAGYDGSVRVWDTATGIVRHTLTGHGESALAVAFSPDGKVLATAGEDGRLRLWDPVTGRSLRELEAHRGRIWGLCFSPDGRELAAAGGDQSVSVWNPTTGAELRRFGELRGGVYAVEFHPSGESIAVAADNAVLLLDARTGRELGRIGTARTAVTWFCFAPDGRSIAYRDGKTLRLWEVASGSERFSIELPTEPAAVAFTSGGRALVVASGEGAEFLEPARYIRPILKADANALWVHLTGADAGLAYRALQALVADPEKTVPVLREKLHAVPDLPRRIDTLIKHLGDEEFAVRESATKDLAAIGADAGPALRKAVTEDPSPEVRLRATGLINRLPTRSRPAATDARAVEVLEQIGTPEARAVLTTLAGRELDTLLKRDAAAALARLRKAKP